MGRSEVSAPERHLTGEPYRNAFWRFCVRKATLAWILCRRMFWPPSWGTQRVGKKSVKDLINFSDVQIWSLPSEDIVLIDPLVIGQWSSKQLDALTVTKIRAMTGEQLSNLICAPNLTNEQVQRITHTLSPYRHVGKISVLVHALKGDPLEREKIQAIGESCYQRCRPLEAREVLVVLARACTTHQFGFLVDAIPFNFIKDLSLHELRNPNVAEFERLDLRVEERQLGNSYKLMQVRRHFEALELQRDRLGADKVWDIEPDKGPWRQLPRDQVRRLRELVQGNYSKEERVEKGEALITSMKLELMARQVHLQTENLRVSEMVELWDDYYLDECEGQTKLLAGVVGPKYDVLQNMTSLLFQKSREDLSVEEHEVLVDTLKKAVEFADSLIPELERGRRIYLQLKRDNEYLQESEQVFLDMIRHEARVGRFSMEFFRRLHELKHHDKAYRILHGDRFEALIVGNPELVKALSLLQRFVSVSDRVQELHDRLHQLMNLLQIVDLRDQCRETIERLKAQAPAGE